MEIISMDVKMKNLIIIIMRMQYKKLKCYLPLIIGTALRNGLGISQKTKCKKIVMTTEKN